MQKVTLFNNIKDTRHPSYIDLEEILKRIKSGRSWPIIEQIRKETNKDKRNILKQSLPSICFSGIFTTRRAADLQRHSGIICLDIDDVPADDLQQVKQTICKDPYTLAAFISPSGNGIKVLCKIPKDEQKHSQYFEALVQHYACPYMDTNTSDVCRVCYESADSRLYYNAAAKTWTQAQTKTSHPTTQISTATLPITDEGEIFKKLITWIEKQEQYYKGNRNRYLFKLASACNRYGVSPTFVEYQFKHLATDIDDKERASVIRSAYSARHLYGSEYFENEEPINQAIGLIKQGKKDKHVRNKLLEATGGDIEAAEALLDKAKKKLDERVSAFWEVSNKGKITFKRSKFINWLQGHGIYRYKVNTSKWVFIAKTENIISEIKRADIKELVREFLKSLPEEFDGISRETLQDFILKGANVYFNQEYLEFLEVLSVTWVRDTPTEAYFYFQDSAVRVTAQNIERIPYSELTGCVWDSQLLDRTYQETDDESNQFKEFLSFVCNNNDDRLEYLRGVIGYLLHSYKDASFCPAIILTDEADDDTPQGGTGKGLFIKGIKAFKRLVTIDGKGFQFNKSFAFQRVNMDTQLMAFEDVNKGFDFEKLFSIITEGLAVEKKFLGEFFMPFEISPKVIITSNYMIKGGGPSHERRRIEIEFSNYFNAEHTPRHEFKGLLFDDWTPKSWTHFDFFMLKSVQMRLKTGHLGLTKPSYVSKMADKKLRAQVGDLVYYYAKRVTEDTPPQHFPLRLTREQVYNDIKMDTSGHIRYAKRTLLNRFRLYLDTKGIKYDEGKSGKERYITIYNSVTSTDDIIDIIDIPF